MPVHTIVWAKECYKLLFAEQVEESMLYEDTTSEDAETSTYMDAVLQYRQLLQSTREAGGEAAAAVVEAAARQVVQTLFVDEIAKQLGMDRYKTAQKTPTVLDASIVNTTEPAPSTLSLTTTQVWSPHQAVAEWMQICAVEAIAANNTMLPAFDKDDDMSMRFVTAASNLRSQNFGIELQSLYSCKGIAGNSKYTSKLRA